MSLRRQVYEWRNIVQNVGDSNFLNGYPISSVGSCITAAMPINKPVDIFIGGIGNNLDMPGRLKAYQYVVIDAVALWPQTLSAQLYVNTTKYFQDPDGVPSRTGGIPANLVRSGWALTVENIWKFKQDIIKSHLYAGMAELPEEITKGTRKV